MYICVCNALTEKCVRSALSETSSGVASVFGKHGTKPKCGKCLTHLKEFVHHVQKDQTAPDAIKIG